MELGFLTVDTQGKRGVGGVVFLASAVFVCFWIQWMLPAALFNRLVLSPGGDYPLCLVTHAFMHVHSVHLAWNLLLLVILGVVLCRRIGSACFIALSLLATLVAGLAHLRFDSDPAIGCSGITYFLIGAAPLADTKATLGIMDRQWRIPIWIAAAIVVAKSLVLLPFDTQGISHAGHYFALALGLAVGLLFVVSDLRKSRRAGAPA